MIPNNLTERFHPSDVKKNQSGQDYVSIATYINRLNSALGGAWDWSLNHWEMRDAPPTAKGKPQYLAIASGTLTVRMDDGAISTRDGIGASINFDPDTSVKTAHAEALKKACHAFGVALYLWSEEERDYIQLQRDAMVNDVELKRLVMTYTTTELGLDPNEQPGREDIIKCLGTDDLSVEKMRSILVERGVL